MAKQTPVLICGSGSAGIASALWLSIYNIPFTILERRPGPMEIGQADGVQCRTVEIYESFGVSEELLRESYHVLEVAFWGTKEGKEAEGIVRKSRAADTMRGLSHMPHVILNQARMNGLLLEAMKKAKGANNAKIEYGWEVNNVTVDESKSQDPESYCVAVTAEKDGKQETWEAKYVLGCDGAHSVVRKSLGFNMIGDTSDTVWGVMDIFPRTNFPDIRRKSTLHSTSGNLLIIPREGGSMVRFYIQLPAGSHPKDIKLKDLQDTAKKVFKPYKMEFASTFWWSAYSIGQRLADNFHKDHRVFLTGDACHTHSPKAGQGMNVSLQDGYNIGWKLGHVLNNLSPVSLLQTYVLERAKTAKDLIDFDKEWAKIFSRRETYPGEFAEQFIKSGRYTAGLTARYEDSEVTDVEGSTQDVAKGITVGMRMPSAQVIRFCDCKAVQLLRVLQSDGRWRIVVFAGDIGDSLRAQQLRKLASSLESLIQKFTLKDTGIDSLIESILILRSKFLETEQEQIPDVFWPVTGKYKMRDLHKVYIDDEHYNSGHGHAYEKYEIDPSRGAVVIVRPDQYVAKVTTLENSKGIERLFSGIFNENGREDANATTI